MSPDERHCDTMRQGCMKPRTAKTLKRERISDADFAKACVAAARKRYASYGPGYFGDAA